ncbi:MAG: glycine cleavage system aminomethyltransferase GcvT [Sphingomonadales bacterium]|nr:glycine cleavage system aminomethyltransferase GcvT [Sphingomonadales bacterium]
MHDDDDIPPIEILNLPLDAWHRAQGARMVEFAGYHMPIQYEGIMAEHEWTRTQAGLFDVSHMGQLMLSGDGAAAALETLVPGDISALRPGRMRYSLLLAEDGGILDDMMVTNTPMGLYLVVNGAVKHEDMGYLRSELPDEVTINYMEDRALLALQGPKAAEALARLIPRTAELYFMEADSFIWDEHPLWISRSGYTGEDGFEISVPADLAEHLAETLCKQPEVKPIGLGARDSLRLEAGLPLYGHDMNPEVNPVEAGAAFAISKRRREEGGFYGAENIVRDLMNGPARKLTGFSVEGRMPVREGAPIFAGQVQIGVMTSGGFAPSVGAPVAMGYIDSDHGETGTIFEAEVRGKRIAVTAAQMPFIPHNYHRRGKTQ